MTFSIDPQIFERHPALRVGLIVVRGADNAIVHSEIIPLLRAAEAQVRSSLQAETFKEHPHIAAWQEAHKKFGNNPNRDQPSVQALVKRVVKGGELPSINSLVDLYNIISITHLLTAGGEDLDRTIGDIRLTLSAASEEFFEIGSVTADPPLLGEVIYRDDQGVICRKFNWREGDRTKLTNQTENAVLVVESLIDDGSLEKSLQELENLVQQFCGGSLKKYILSPDQVSVEM